MQQIKETNKKLFEDDDDDFGGLRYKERDIEIGDLPRITEDSQPKINDSELLEERVPEKVFTTAFPKAREWLRLYQESRDKQDEDERAMAIVEANKEQKK